jgi:hypothetical protein
MLMPRIMSLLREESSNRIWIGTSELDQHPSNLSLSGHATISQMRKEEMILFPYINVLAKSKDKVRNTDCCTGTSLNTFVARDRKEHLVIEQGSLRFEDFK